MCKTSLLFDMRNDPGHVEDKEKCEVTDRAGQLQRHIATFPAAHTPAVRGGRAKKAVACFLTEESKGQELLERL